MHWLHTGIGSLKYVLLRYHIIYIFTHGNIHNVTNIHLLNPVHPDSREQVLGSRAQY